MKISLFLSILLSLSACKPSAPTKPEAPVLNVSKATALGNALRNLSDLKLEPDPQKRPLILSEPAEDRRSWVFQALRTGYQRTGQTNIPCDKRILEAFDAYAIYTRIDTTNWISLTNALAVVDPACQEPMIQYMRARYPGQIVPPIEQAISLLRAHDAMARSQHHPLFKFMAGLRAIQAARDAEADSPRGIHAAWTITHLEDLARDTNAPAQEIFEAAGLLIEHGQNKRWLEFLTKDLLPLLERGWKGNELWFRFLGRTEIRFAWGDRGGGWASSVDKAGWEGFEQHLARAEQALTKAWQMNSNIAETCYLMMKVELGQGEGQERMQLWFDRALTLETNFYDAASLMSFYLEPRWYGSEESALAFGRQCVQSDQWGGSVPLVLVDTHHSLARYKNLKESPEYWHRPSVWNDVKAAYDKFFALYPDAVGWRHNYARDAFLCGKYSAFLEQTKQFAFGTNYAYFGGPARFQSMVETAAAAVASEQ